MKRYLFVLFYLALVPSFILAQEKIENASTELLADTLAGDSTTYKLVVFELGYENYLLRQPMMEHYSVSYYKNWNRLYAMEWNKRFLLGPDQQLYQEEINYDYNTDYGIELEYQLYHYFRFFEEKYQVKLVERGK